MSERRTPQSSSRLGRKPPTSSNLIALNDVYVEQTTGNLPLFALTSTNGNAYVTVDNGSLVNVNTNVKVDPRTTAELLAGAWTALQLTANLGAQTKVDATLVQYQQSEEAQYQTYWQDRNSLVDGQVQLTPEQASDYTAAYTSEGEAQGLTGTALTSFVTNALSTIELSLTQQYYNLATIFGAGGSYDPGVTNVYDAATKTTVSTPVAYDPNTFDPNFVYLLTDSEVSSITGSIHVWTESQLLAGISAGLLQTSPSTLVENSAPNISAKNIVITAGKGNIGSLVNPAANFSATADVVGFAPGTDIDQTPVQLAFAAAQLSDLNFLAAVPLVETVNFSGKTMTLANGASWSSLNLDIQPGDLIYIGGNSQNATQNGSYLVVAADGVNGSTITFTNSVVPESNESVLVAPVVANLESIDASTAGAIGGVTVNFGDAGNSGTITLTSGTWGSGYASGEGIFIQSATDQNANSAGAFSPTSTNGYYTISSISADRKTITLNWGETLVAEGNVTVGAAPVNIDIVSGAADVQFVLVSQSRDVAIAPSATGEVDASAQGFIYLASQDNLQLDHIVSTGGADVRVRTQGSLTNVATSGVNVQGAEVILEAGASSIGTSSTPVTVMIDAGGSLIARALHDIYIDAPSGNLPIQAIYAGGGVSLEASGSIYDAITSDFAKIQADWLELSAGAAIGAGSFGTGDASLYQTITLDALHVDIISTGLFDSSTTDGALRAWANGSIDVDQTPGDLNVLDAYSTGGDVMLEAQGNIYGGNLSDPSDRNSAPITGDINASVFGDNVFLYAGVTVNGVDGFGSVGSGQAAFNIVSSFSGGADSGAVSALSGGDYVYLDEVSTTLTTTSNGDLRLESVSAGSAVTAFMTDLVGPILNARGDDKAIVVSGKADLIASGDVGSGTDRPGGLTGRIVSTAGNVEAISESGSIYLWNIGALVVGGVVSPIVDPYALYAPNGSIDIQTSSPLEISQSVFATGSIIKRAGNSTDAPADIRNSNLTVDAGVTIQSTQSFVELDAGNNITLDGSTIVNGVIALAGAEILAATSITLNAGYLDDVAPAEGDATDSVFIDSGAVLNAGSAITVNAGNVIAIEGASGVVGAPQLIAGSIVLNGGYLPAISAFDGNSVTLTLYGSFAGQTLAISTGGGDDDIEFSPAAMGLTGATTIDSGAGDDTIHVFNLPNMTTLATIDANAGQIADTINLDGQDGADNYLIDTTVATNYVINVNDSGALDSGLNSLIINGANHGLGPDIPDARHVRRHRRTPNGQPAYQRINYNDTITNRLTINGGDVTGALLDAAGADVQWRRLLSRRQFGR